MLTTDETAIQWHLNKVIEYANAKGYEVLVGYLICYFRKDGKDIECRMNGNKYVRLSNLKKAIG